METVLITGTSSGIGHALAAAYLQRGARVLGTSRRRPEGLAGNYQHGIADFADLDAIAETLRALLEDVEQLDLVVLNAGILGRIDDLPAQSLPELRQVMDINLWANKLILDWLFAHVTVKQVVAVSSAAAVNGSRGWGGYSLSKAALNMLIKLVAAEHPGCHFQSLAPGLVYTQMQDTLGGIQDSRFPSLDQIRAAHGTPTMPTPADLAPRLMQVIEAVLPTRPSGCFVDIRDLAESQQV
ncbi:MAG: benzil reductase ((S)-benzoin forming) [Rhodothermales bacterium]|jgi:benzil reductase ((S)-benzoin forming)